VGQDVDANIAFGIDLEYENPFKELHEVDDLEELLADKAGLVYPGEQVLDDVFGGYGQDAYAAYRKWIADNLPNYNQELTEYNDAKSKLMESCPVEIDHYGAESEWGHVLYIKGTIIHGGWEGTTEVCPPDLVIPTEKIEEAAKFCESIDFPAFENPRWLLYGRLW
jgi:hypothetical protein